MQAIYGFSGYDGLVNNTPNKVATFGELSANSRTYAKDKTDHTLDAYPKTTFISFHSVEDNNTVAIPGTTAETIVKVSDYLFKQGLDGLVTDDTQLLTNLQSEFDTVLKDVSCGALIEDDAGNVTLPERILFTDITTANDIEVTVWLSDGAFAAQYPNYEIEIIPPFENVDDFFQDPSLVKAQLQDIIPTETTERIQEARGDYPPTRWLTNRYDYVNRNNSDDTAPTYWNLLLYGQAANNPDLIKNAIVEWVLERSEHSREEWAAILPDLFTFTEFVVVPFWTQYSVPNKELQAGIYSPTLHLGSVMDLLKSHVKGGKYDAAWIEAEAEVSTLQYKSLAFGVVGNPDNRDGIVRFSNHFSDYMVIPNDSADFNRITPRTQEFMDLLWEMIKVAETFTSTSTPPVGMARVIRDDRVYLTAMYENFNYLVLAKPSLVELTA